MSQPNGVRAGDTTYVWSMESWLYLAVLLDLFSPAIIGLAVDPRLKVDLTEQALSMALSNVHRNLLHQMLQRPL